MTSKARVIQGLIEWLNFQRKHPDDFVQVSEFLRQTMKSHKISFSDLGTNAKEIHELQRKSLLFSLQKEISILRYAVLMNETTDNFGHFQFLLKKARLSLKAVGVTPEELHSFRCQNYKLHAISLLSLLRRTDIFIDRESYQQTIKDLSDILKHACLSLKDIGTTQKEIDSYRPDKLACNHQLDLRTRASLTCWLEDLRKGHYPKRIKRLIADQILAECKGIDWSLKHIGTSREELSKYRE